MTTTTTAFLAGAVVGALTVGLGVWVRREACREAAVRAHVHGILADAQAEEQALAMWAERGGGR